MFILLLALLPACCAVPAPPPKPAEPAPEPVVAPPVHVARPVLRTTWSFQAGPDACVALAKAGAASLQIAVRREGLIRLTLTLPGDAPARPVARFNGSAGHWLVTGTSGGHRNTLFTLDRTEISLSRVLVLLSGGTLSLEPPADVPILSLPETGADGQQWFACVRRIVT